MSLHYTSESVLNFTVHTISAIDDHLWYNHKQEYIALFITLFQETSRLQLSCRSHTNYLGMWPSILA